MHQNKSKVTYCRICRRTYRNSHACTGEKALVKCQHCDAEMLQSSLSKHIEKNCPSLNHRPGTIDCPCGITFTIGHNNGQKHLNTIHHILWEENDAKERELGVILKNNKFCRAESSIVDKNNLNFFRGVNLKGCRRVCKRLHKKNEGIIGEPDIVYCFCGVNCRAKDYDDHCLDKFHVNWVQNCKDYYEEIKEERDRKSKKRQRQRLKAKEAKAREEEASCILNEKESHDKIALKRSHPEKEVEEVKELIKEKVNEGHDLSKYMLEFGDSSNAASIPPSVLISCAKDCIRRIGNSDGDIFERNSEIDAVSNAMERYNRSITIIGLEQFAFRVDQEQENQQLLAIQPRAQTKILAL
eukprot:TRINITY_DN1677_c0_g1_i2.p4 TRINITY_DN1677_c0_g1~~TRINITY_DN1677_c0_g1_i2.p4  ORF type:complete len:355 (-),score=25.35 TRINITY_DN1677_c0_g1_i2:6641-7705(-)